MRPTLLERYAGTMVGVLAGDSLGAPYEKWESENIEEDLRLRGGLVPFDYEDPWGRSGHFPAGRPTDDSELTAALAQSLIECGGSDPSHQYKLFKRAVNGQSYVWEGKADGFGRTTRTMLKAANLQRAWDRENRPRIASNGSLMRSAPLALWYHLRAPSTRDDAMRASSKVTHIHPTAIECCVLYGYLLHRLLHGLAPRSAWAEVVERKPNDSTVRAFLERPFSQPEASNVWMNRDGPAGSALHTFHIAVWSLLTANNFRDGIECAVRFGGDTDTAAAVAGSLLGARFGIEGIPAEWRQVLKGHNRMTELAQGLYTETF